MPRRALPWFFLGVWTGVMLLTITPASQAHFHTYWPQVEGCFGKPGEVVEYRYFWGHPHEMIIYDAQAPKFFLRLPQGQKEPLTAKEISLTDQESGKTRKAYSVTYTPGAPGDYYLCLEAQPYFIKEEKLFWQDYVKQPFHVMAQKGWSLPVKHEVEIVPLTRPYGWPAGSVFVGQARFRDKPLREAVVELEKFSGAFVPKDKLPKDRLGEPNEPLITRTMKTDIHGYFSCTLDSPGWWVIAVGVQDGKKVHEGQAYPVEKRGCLWVYSEPNPPPPTK